MAWATLANLKTTDHHIYNDWTTLFNLQFQVISATLPDVTTVDFWAEPREKSFGRLDKFGCGGGNFPAGAPNYFSRRTPAAI